MKVESSLIGFAAFLLLAGVVSASVLNAYGYIQGTANVEGPRFYANLTEDGTYELILNKNPSVKRSIIFSDGNTIVFWSDDFGGIDFGYKPKCKFSIKINSTEESAVELSCYQDSLLSSSKICSVVVTAKESPKVVEASCSGNSTLSDVENIVYEVKGGGDSSVNYQIQTNPSGNTKLQVDKA